MFVFLKNLLSKFNPANQATFVGKQLKNPTGIFANKVAAGMNVSNKNLYDLTFSNLELSDGEMVLEIGFGNGYFFEQLSRKNRNVKLFGAEISKEMISQCSKLNYKLIADQKLDVKLFSGSTLPYENKMFDKAIAINLIYFWQNPADNIKELNRVLRNDGELLVGIRPFNVLSHLPFAQEGFNIQKDHWWIELFESYGFRLTNNLTTTELPLQFNGKTYEMSGTCLVFKKWKDEKGINNQYHES